MILRSRAKHLIGRSRELQQITGKNIAASEALGVKKNLDQRHKAKRTKYGAVDFRLLPSTSSPSANVPPDLRRTSGFVPALKQFVPAD